MDRQCDEAGIGRFRLAAHDVRGLGRPLPRPWAFRSKIKIVVSDRRHPIASSMIQAALFVGNACQCGEVDLDPKASRLSGVEHEAGCDDVLGSRRPRESTGSAKSRCPDLMMGQSESPCSRASARVSQPCQTITGSMTSAASESTHHQPKSAYAPTPMSSASDR